MVSVKCEESFEELIKWHLLMKCVSFIIPSVAVIPVRLVKLNVQITCVQNM
jgi:hypothetical protein